MSFVWKRAARSLFAVAASAALGLCATAQEKKGAAKSGGSKADAAAFQVPVEYYKLPNGLRVVLSQDHTAPTVCVAVYYRIGFRVEPKDRTGFAHLFEHMMFQGSQNLGKMEFIKLVQQNGGILNGSTRFDFKNYFDGIKQTQQLPSVPDLSEPKQEKEKLATKVDALAKRPAIAVAYHMPERNTPEYYAMGLLDQILIEGDDSLEHQELVQKRGLTAGLEGGINYLGNMFNYKGPMLFMADLRFDPGTSPETIIKAWDEALQPLRTKPIDKLVLERARVKLRSEDRKSVV